MKLAARLVAARALVETLFRPRCLHLFPERGIGCPTCDSYHWQEDAENLRVLDDRLARIEEAMFPLEPSERIWIAERPSAE